MHPYQTFAQVLIAASAIRSALAAPLPAKETHDAREGTISQLDRRKTIPVGEMAAFAVGSTAGYVAGHFLKRQERESLG